MYGLLLGDQLWRANHSHVLLDIVLVLAVLSLLSLQLQVLKELGPVWLLDVEFFWPWRLPVVLSSVKQPALVVKHSSEVNILVGCLLQLQLLVQLLFRVDIVSSRVGISFGCHSRHVALGGWRDSVLFLEDLILRCEKLVHAPLRPLLYQLLGRRSERGVDFIQLGDLELLVDPVLQVRIRTVVMLVL